MRRALISLILVLSMLVSLCGYAEGTDEIFPAETVPQYDLTAYGDIQLGAENKNVVAIQKRLIELGYMVGEADGSYWTKTKKAIMWFEKVNYITVTEDYISAEAQAVLFSDTAVEAPEIICSQGDTSDKVYYMQQCLIEWGFMNGRADGVYGTGTASCLAEFQTTMWKRAWDERHKEDGIPFEESGYVADGTTCDAIIYQYFTDKSYTVIYDDLVLGDKGADVGRLQNLLYKYNYLWHKPDNTFDYFTQAAVIAFQKAHDMTATGIADTEMQTLLASDEVIPCEKPAKPYRIVIDVDEQKVYVYAWDGEGYTSVVRIMNCSSGKEDTPTPVGIFTNTYALNQWHFFRFFNCWAQYSYVIQGGVMFHSVLYYNRIDSEGNNTHGYVDKPSVENLGTRQSHGCIRLQVEDAQWIFGNCPRGTEVEVVQLNPDPKIETAVH